MAVTLSKITDATTERDGMIYRGTPIKITRTMITIKITQAWGAWSGEDWSTLSQGRHITAPLTDCDLYRR